MLHDLGDLDGAREHSERALAIREAVWGPDHGAVSRSVATLARMSLEAGDTEQAWELGQRLKANRHQVRHNLATLTEGEGHLYLAALNRQRDTFLATAAAVHEQAAGYAAVLESKGRLARMALATRAQIRAALDPETLALAEVLQQLDGRLSQLALRSDIPDRQAHLALLDELRDERDALERRLLRRTEREPDRTVSPEMVAAALPPRSAIVDLAVHEAFVPAHPDTPGQGGHWEQGRVSAWVLRSGESDVAHVDLGPVAAIEPAIQDYLASLLGPTAAVTARGKRLAPRPVSGSSRAARRLVWDPLLPHLADVDTLFLSPDGVLGTLPFQALQDDAGRFLIEDYSIVYPTDVASMVSAPPGAAPPSSVDISLLSLGDADFGADLGTPESARRNSFEGSWSQLPATAGESAQVAELHARAATSAARRLLLQGTDATEQRLRREMPRHAILHLATHGFFLPDGLPSMWEAAREALTDGGARQLAPAARRLTGLHPGLLSGLVLTSANRSPGGHDDGEDGYLTASEVTRLDLSGVQLVVLSACDTGLGRPRSGEGLIGLRRAFHMAGADTVISSLWSVEDESTSELMQAFYRHLLIDGMGRQQALRSAQLERLAANRREHGDARPGTWAAFVLSGVP